MLEILPTVNAAVVVSEPSLIAGRIGTSLDRRSQPASSILNIGARF
jgi:hypothetical protein